MSDGSITIIDPISVSDTVVVRFNSFRVQGAKTFSGGIIYLGDGASSSTGGDSFRINAGVPLNNLIVKNQQGGINRTAKVVTNPLVLNGALTIESGGSFNANRKNISLKGNWTNDGTYHCWCTGTVTFNGSGTQNIGGSVSTAFRNMTVNSGATVQFPTSNEPTVAGTLTNNGTLQQTKSVTGAGDVNFFNTGGYGGVTINAIDALKPLGTPPSPSRAIRRSVPPQSTPVSVAASILLLRTPRDETRRLQSTLAALSLADRRVAP